MRLVEVVMLMGAHCVSPVEHGQLMTEATKVQCAVVVEKDTDRGAVTVTPQHAAGDPQVAAAVARLGAAPADARDGARTRIVPARAPAGTPTTEIKLPETKSAVLPEPVAPPVDEPLSLETATAPAPDVSTPAPAPAAASEAQPQAEKKLAMMTPPPPKRTAPKQVEKKPAAKAQPARAAKPGQCKGSATAKWYTTADGRKKYRCVKPTGGAAPDQLY